MSLLQDIMQAFSKFPKILGMGNDLGYFHLLFRTGPDKLDVFLLAVGGVTAIGAGIPFPLLGILFGQLVDELNSTSCNVDPGRGKQEMQSSVNQKVLLMIYISIANFLAIYVHTVCWSLFGGRLVHRLRTRYFQGILHREAAFFDTLPVGENSMRLSDDIETIRTGTSEKVGICISSFTYFFGAYAVAFAKDARLAGILVSLVPAYLLMAAIGSRYVQRYTRNTSDFVAAAMSIASQSLSSINLIHAFGASKRMEIKFAANLGKAQTEGLKRVVAAAIQFGLLFFIAYSANALAFWQGSIAIAATANSSGPAITAGAVYTVIFLLVDASFIISQVAPFMQIFGAAAACLEKLTVDLDRSSSINGSSLIDVAEGKVSSPVRGSIKIQNVTFHYPTRPVVDVLRGLSLNFPSGKHTAIVGPSGSGKSTVGALLARLYDIHVGKITLDGHDIQDLNVSHLRSHIGIIDQDSSLLDRSVLENIAHGLINSSSARDGLEATLLGPSLSELVEAVRQGQSMNGAVTARDSRLASIFNLAREAARLADADDFIGRLEHGYATLVGPRGCKLSGGQKQRIAFARAVIKDPPILLLDEATSSLDSASEQAIQTSLRQILKGRTAISIAHRLASVKDADNIVVLQHGQVIEQGTHSDLLAKNGVYASMAESQKLRSPITMRSESLEISSTRIEDPEVDNAQNQCSYKNAFDQTSESFNPTESRNSQRSLCSTFRGIAYLARPYLLFAIIGFIAAVFVGGTYSGEAVIFGHTIGNLSPCEGGPSIRSAGRLFGLLFFIFALLALFANVLSGSAFGWVAEKVVYKVRILSLRALLHQDVLWHSSGNRTPALLLSYLSKDASSLGSLSGTTIGTIVAVLANLITGILLTHIIAWKIAFILLATLPILIYSGIMRLRILAQIQDRHRSAYATSVSISTEAMDLIKTVKCLSIEKEVFATYCRSLVGPFKASIRDAIYANFWLASAYSMSNLIYALAYWWGSKQIINGVYSQTQFFIVLPALLFSAQSCGQMFALAPDLSNARVASARLLDLLDLGPQEFRDPAPIRATCEKDLEAGEGNYFPRTIKSEQQPRTGIDFRDVYFSYPARPQYQVLRGLNIKVPPGQFCALVGPSGAGKSTIVSLVEKFYRPSSGQVEIDGKDIFGNEDPSFRDRISLVPQENTLFDDTVRFNVGLGARSDHEATDEEIEHACKLANIHEFITTLPQGYDTLCGSNGDLFSGGQKQRLAIARALVRQPRILLLDESSSALDAESEQRFQDTLEKVSHGVTIIAIAHRLHTIQKAHQIFLIEGGKCVEQGTHAELYQRSASYRSNVLHQSLGAA